MSPERRRRVHPGTMASGVVFVVCGVLYAGDAADVWSAHPAVVLGVVVAGWTGGGVLARRQRERD